MLTVHQVQASWRGDERALGGGWRMCQHGEVARGNQSRESPPPRPGAHPWLQAGFNTHHPVCPEASCCRNPCPTSQTSG